jgi:DNA-binding GntR family transcriptional regulator
VTQSSQPPRGRHGAVLDHVSLPEAVTRALRHRILNNELPAGTRLVEASLAAELGVSRGTIRDAMRSLRAEGLIEIVPRRYSVVTRMSAEDAEDVCYARYVLENASVEGGFGAGRKELAKELRLAIEHMSVAARLNDMDALVDSDTQFHEVLIDMSGRRRLKDLWSMLNSQMGALMRAELERQGIEMAETARRHLGILEAVSDGDLDRLRAELWDHYLLGFPVRDRMAGARTGTRPEPLASARGR